MLYPATPRLSVAAVQDKSVVEVVVPEAESVATDGAVVSAGARVVTFTVLLAAEKFPAASFATT